MNKGQQFTMKVVSVICNVTKKNNDYIHEIIFQHPQGGSYTAHEPVEYPNSAFTPGQNATFEIMSKGNGGKPDWIKFCGNEGQIIISRDKLSIAMTSYQCAARLAGLYAWSQEEVGEQAKRIAEEMFTIAQNL